MLVFPLGYDTNMGLCVWHYICTYTIMYVQELMSRPKGGKEHLTTCNGI